MNTFQKAKEIFSKIEVKNSNDILRSQIVADLPGMFDAYIKFSNKRELSITVVNEGHSFESKVTFWEIDGNTKLILSTVDNFSISDFQFDRSYPVTYKEMKKQLGLKDSDIAKMFDMNPGTFANSSAKDRYENALCSFYDIVKAGGEKRKEKD